jgi:hypothetical protein
MLKSHYIEDIFITFYTKLISSNLVLGTDIKACDSFYKLCIDNKPLTEKQSAYMLMLMKKHRNSVISSSFDYTVELENPVFKHAFRVVDNQRRAYIEKDKDGRILLCCKFPFAFKGKFDKGLEEYIKHSTWDQVRGARIIEFYNVNPITIFEFLQEHSFEMDESFLHAISETETAWSNIENISPRSIVVDSAIELKSSNEYAQDHFKNSYTGSIIKDQFLAKTMGYPAVLEKSAETALEKIVSSNLNTFWIKTSHELLKIYKALECKTAIVLDRNDDKLEWLEEFLHNSDSLEILRSKIKVCFREQKGSTEKINTWIKENDLGGKVDDGDIFIFDHKPAKWIFKEKNFIKIAVSTSKYPPTNVLTKDWIDSHACSIYLSDIKPTVKGNKKLVNL